jgi:hypothetical protein
MKKNGTSQENSLACLPQLVRAPPLENHWPGEYKTIKMLWHIKYTVYTMNFITIRNAEIRYQCKYIQNFR